MKAKFKSGKVITGRLAETFTRIGITSEVKRGRKPAEEAAKVPEVDGDAKIPVEKTTPKKKKNEKKD
jgi:hypothetical protein